VLLDRHGNNPICHYRSLELENRGLRERIERRMIGTGKPFDHGVFRLIEEPVDAPWPARDTLHFTYESVRWPAGWDAWPIPEAKPAIEPQALIARQAEPQAPGEPQALGE
jgi:hypothetical protein